MLKNEHAINVLLKEKDTWEDLASKAVELKSIEDWRQLDDCLYDIENLRWEIRNRLANLVFKIGKLQTIIERECEEEMKKEEVK
jgi:hypothetical protein